MSKQTISARYCVRVGYGYAVEVTNGIESIEYTAGDSFYDSQEYCTGDLDEKTLTKYAKQTASEMMLENYGEVGNIVYDDSLLTTNTEGA